MSWGYKVTLITLSFVCLMTGLVIAAFRQNVDLVTEDYYGKELQFQSQIDKQKNYSQLQEGILCEQNDSNLVVTFTNDFKNQEIKGQALLFRPSDASKDIYLKLEPVHGVQKIDKHQLIPGLYTIQLDYTVADKSYYFEENIMIY
ncbi:MAG: hypothetical protein JWO58_2929 [Chitinophagaceae bacterium]|nr:hypothetical protein [Chitinophagaceae bacterium]